jgi:hypothetical protein
LKIDLPKAERRSLRYVHFISPAQEKFKSTGSTYVKPHSTIFSLFFRRMPLKALKTEKPEK